MVNESKRCIGDIRAQADAAIDAMGGPRAFVDALHKGPKTEFLTRLKEDLALVQFSEIYNPTNSPKLKYAARNLAGPDRADFTIWDESMEWSRDLELTSVWEREDDFPKVPDGEDPDVTHVWLSEPRLPLDQLCGDLTRNIRRVLDRHARRRKYPTYWLAIYANLSLEAYKLSSDYVAEIVRERLIQKSPSSNVERVWVWNMRLDLVFSS
jgi:hypothetical protein